MHSFQRDAGGSRTHEMLCCRQPPHHVTSASKRIRAESRETKARGSREDILWLSSLDPRLSTFNVLARSRTWSTTFAKSRASTTLQGQAINSAPPRSRTSPGSFEDCHASTTLAGRSASFIKRRRLDSHQHKPVYKTGAFLSRATSANSDLPEQATARVQGVEP